MFYSDVVVCMSAGHGTEHGRQNQLVTEEEQSRGYDEIAIIIDDVTFCHRDNYETEWFGHMLLYRSTVCCAGKICGRPPKAVKLFELKISRPVIPVLGNVHANFGFLVTIFDFGAHS